MRFDIMVAGVGGTGGCFFSKMVRFLSGNDLPAEISLRIMDGDTVEYKNLGRQPFTEEDIGRNKAVALASAASELGVQVKAYPHYLSPGNTDILGDYERGQLYEEPVQIFVGGVDNHAARKVLHHYFMGLADRFMPAFYLDSANEISAGEIVIAKTGEGRLRAPGRPYYFPDIFEKPGKAVYEMSCEELNQAAPQHLATNSLAADLLFSYVVQLISLDFEGIRRAKGGIIWFDAFKCFSRLDFYEDGKEKDQRGGI